MMTERMFSLWCGIGGNLTYPKEEHVSAMEEFILRCADAGVTMLHPTLVLDDYLPAFAVFGDPRFGGASPTISDYYGLWNPWPFMIDQASLKNIQTQPYLAINSHGWQLPKDDALVPEKFPYVLGLRYAILHPEFWARDRLGRPVVDTTGRIVLSPAFPEVRRYLTSGLCDVVRRYRLTGIQLEYVMEPLDGAGIATIGYEDPIAAAFQRDTGNDPLTLPNDEPCWLQFRAGYYGLLVRDIRVALDGLQRELGQEIELSISIVAREEDEYLKALQDWPTWVAKGYVGRVCLWHRDEDIDAIQRRTACAGKAIAGRCHLTSQISVYHPHAIHSAKPLLEAAQRSLAAGADSIGIYRGDAVWVHDLWHALETIARF